MVRLPTCTYLHAQGDHRPAVDGVNAVFTVFLELFEVPLLRVLFPRRGEFNVDQFLQFFGIH